MLLSQRTPETIFFSWLASDPERADYLVPLVPTECFSQDGQQILQRFRAGAPPSFEGVPADEHEAVTFLRNQLLALVGREAGRAQRHGQTERVLAVADLLAECVDGLEPPPLEDYAAAMPTPREYLPTGIVPLDQQILGLAKGDLGICALPSGKGKTAVLINASVAALRAGKSVLYITVADQSRNELLPRIDSCILADRSDDQSLHTLTKRHREAAELITGQLWLSDMTDSECSLTDIARIIRACQSDLVVVDHADDIVSRYTSDPAVTRHSLRTIYKTLKQLAVTHNVPLWTASQSHDYSWGQASAGIDVLVEAKIGKVTGAAIVIVFTGGSPEITGRMYCTIAKARRRITQRVVSISYDHAACLVY